MTKPIGKSSIVKHSLSFSTRDRNGCGFCFWRKDGSPLCAKSACLLKKITIFAVDKKGKTMKEKKTFEIYVDYHYGPDEVYVVEATSLAEAKKKAIARYMREYFKKSYIRAVKSA